MGFRQKYIDPLGLGQSSPHQSLPVVAGHGGARPGQNRDNFPTLFANLVFVRRRHSYKRPRSRADRLDDEAADLERRLDEIVNDFHARLPRSDAKSIGVAYARYSTDFQHSIEDQIREIFVNAVELGIFIPRNHVCFDMAKRGFADRRPGLIKARQILEKRSGTVLLVFTTNRLYRKLYKTIKFVEEEVVDRGLRCIFVKTKIDTISSTNWRMPLQCHGMVDEMTATMYAENIRAAHIGLFLNRFVVTSLPYGYTGQPVDGYLTKRHRPRRLIVIDPVTSEWVKRVFHWFLIDRLDLTVIIARLNSEKAPLPERAQAGFWDWRMVRGVLANECYRGFWTYGRGQNVWNNKLDYAKCIKRDKPLAEKHFEELRLLDDDEWYRVQLMLENLWKSRGGRKRKDPNSPKRPRILNGMLLCAVHNRPMRACGSAGQWIGCSHCQAMGPAERPIHTYLPRMLAIQTICQCISDHIRNDQTLCDEIVNACREHANSFQSTNPQHIGDLSNSIDKLKKQIEFLLDNQGETESDRQETSIRLRELRNRRTGLQSELEHCRMATARPTKLPTSEEVHALLSRLATILGEAAESGEPEDANAVRAIIELITGGRIIMEQAGERKRFRGWLRGRFQIRLVSAAMKELMGVDSPVPLHGTDVVIDFRSNTIAERNANAVKALYDQDILITEIGARLGIDRHQVSDALRIWADRRGLPKLADGRERRASLSNKNLKPSRTEAMSELVKKMRDDNVEIQDIARKMRCSRDTVRAAWQHWFRSRGLAIPDGRRRPQESESDCKND